ncbi:hypothetical protein NSK_007820 [Nannochloropsis salina CCMP1776]|uniref:Uncharacterized protein n=1 Tax=Nannochloropsis salina CCMP1776 TaxID=1027361 RepID=A0A4D9CNW1_9STRA|nr:hypothetical protein NSK_007820 [Nannochloropsis salina CCMP1776]|eukprot:TFJ80820.1 hypothetical protein NSK_007820 [Nannochloropsis salina CCMP1776]
MGKVIRTCRKGVGGIFKSHTKLNKNPVKLRKLDYAEKHGYIKGVVKEIVHESGRGAPIARVQFKNAYRFKRDTESFVAVEGIYSGAREGGGEGGREEGRRDTAAGTFARTSGGYAVIVAQDEDRGTTKIRLPSGAKKDRVFLVSWGDWHHRRGGAHGQAYAQGGACLPQVRGVAMNPVEHPHGGGNHQHIGHPSTVKRDAPAGKKVGLVAARRTGRLRGIKKNAEKDQ